MKLLETRIQQDGQVLGADVLKVDSFLNHQIDPDLMAALGQAFYDSFKDAPITKILTVESSGIAPALATGMAFHLPVVFARKHKSLTLKDNLYTAGVGIVIEKTFQKGRKLLDDRHIKVTSLARIQAFEDGQVVFAQD